MNEHELHSACPQLQCTFNVLRRGHHVLDVSAAVQLWLHKVRAALQTVDTHALPSPDLQRCKINKRCFRVAKVIAFIQSSFH